MDNPSLTQPIMYDVIENRTTVPDTYAKKLEVWRSNTLSVILIEAQGLVTMLNHASCIVNGPVYHASMLEFMTV